MSNEVINEEMDEVERERMVTRGAVGPSGGDPAANIGASAEPTEVVRIDSAEGD